jgi:DME family drug/metabolite transporter
LLEPLTAAVLAVVILGEPLPALEIVGGLVLLAAIAALYLAPQPPAPELDAPPP